MDRIGTQAAALLLQQGKIIAYPTEAVFGLGCDPDNAEAITALLQLKQRAESKGLILIASDIAQLLPYIDIQAVPAQRWELIQKSWPGPFTWVFPATNRILPLIKGQYQSVAVRVTAHPVAKSLAQAFQKPLVSTSANISAQAPCKTASEIEKYFTDLAGIVEGEIGSEAKPTTVQDAITGQVYR